MKIIGGNAFLNDADIEAALGKSYKGRIFAPRVKVKFGDLYRYDLSLLRQYIPYAEYETLQKWVDDSIKPAKKKKV